MHVNIPKHTCYLPYFSKLFVLKYVDIDSLNVNAIMWSNFFLYHIDVYIEEVFEQLYTVLIIWKLFIKTWSNVDLPLIKSKQYLWLINMIAIFNPY